MNIKRYNKYKEYNKNQQQAMSEIPPDLLQQHKSFCLRNILLSLNNITYTELTEQFKYAGGDCGSHLKYFMTAYPYKKHLKCECLCKNKDNVGMTFYDTKNDRTYHVLTPEHEDECLCGVKILENCYITNDDSTFYVIGNCCIKRFLSKDKRGRTCGICSKPHKNSKDNKCNDCRMNELNKGFCIDCKRDIDKKYKKCYKCNKKILK